LLSLLSEFFRIPGNFPNLFIEGIERFVHSLVDPVIHFPVQVHVAGVGIEGVLVLHHSIDSSLN